MKPINLDARSIEQIAAAVIERLGSSQQVKIFTPPQAAEFAGVKASRIIEWITQGPPELRLPAANISRGTVPRYKIRSDDLLAHLKRLTTNTTPKPSRRRFRKPVTEYV